MSLDREIVTAIIVILSKARKARADIAKVEMIDGLRDVEKALGILGHLNVEAESSTTKWKEKFEMLRGDLEDSLVLYESTLDEYSRLMEADLLEMLEEWLPDPKYRDMIEAELDNLSYGKGHERTDETEVRIAKNEAMPVSRLERKLERVKSDTPDSGLDRFLEEEDS